MLSEGNLRKWILFNAWIILALAGALMALGSGAPPHDGAYNPGFQQALIWFELVLHPAELQSILGPPDASGQAMRRMMDRIQLLDYIFLIAYPLFNFALLLWFRLRLFGPRHGTLPLLFPALAAFAMYLGDALENRALLALSADSLRDWAAREWIQSLRIWSDLKWTSIFLALLLLARYWLLELRARHRSPIWIIAALPLLTAFVGLVGTHAHWAASPAELAASPVAICNAAGLRVLVEGAASGVALSWLVSWIYVWRTPPEEP